MSERSGVVTFLGNPLTLVGNPVKVGETAPDFGGLRGDLSPFKLSELGGKVVIINSVPSLDTSVCAMQARRFNQEAAGLGAGVKVVVVSMDLPFAQKRFCATEGIANLETISDHRDATFGQAFGLLIKELRLDARAVLVVDSAGVVRYQQVVAEMTHEPDYEAALAAVRSLL
ncbi:MAG: thiol peroxidase [Thermoanaerobaculaceae bacterium]|jgi:thiol peroxidase|nr:thiol peroxidase [Thermoanaerobaculaceae bacterium]